MHYTLDSSRGLLGFDSVLYCGNYYNTTWRHNPEDLDLNLHRRKNLKSRYALRFNIRWSVSFRSLMKLCLDITVPLRVDIGLKEELSLCHRGWYIGYTVWISLTTTPWRSIGEWRYNSTHSLTSALDGGDWSASRSDCFTQGMEPQ
jgi:hypothetical protein